jgi:hypothetical protein
MAHHIKIKVRPHINKDGTESKTKCDYVVIDRFRGKQVEVGVASNRKAAENLITLRRKEVLAEQVQNHKNDPQFKSKHGLVEITKGN